MPAAAMRDCAIASACVRSSRSTARRMPVVKSSKPVASTIESSTKATTTSMSVNPTSRLAEGGRPGEGGGPILRLVGNRDPSREPVHVDLVFALTRRDGYAPAGGAAVGIEADRALALAHGLGLRGVELELQVLGKGAGALGAGYRELTRVEVQGERGIAPRGHGGGLRLAQARGERSRGRLQVRHRGAA